MSASEERLRLWAVPAARREELASPQARKAQRELLAETIGCLEAPGVLVLYCLVGQRLSREVDPSFGLVSRPFLARHRPQCLFSYCLSPDSCAWLLECLLCRLV